MGKNKGGVDEKIAILNFKGGTGKTTTAVNLSAALALKRFKAVVKKNK